MVFNAPGTGPRGGFGGGRGGGRGGRGGGFGGSMYGGGFQIPQDILIHMQSTISQRDPRSPMTFFVEFDGHQSRSFEKWEL